MVGILIGALALALGEWYYFGGDANWQTMVFTSLAFAQIGQALAARSNHASLFTIGLRSNPSMLGMVLTVALLQLSVIYLSPMRSFFGTSILSPADLGIALGVGVVVFTAIEVEKNWRLK